MTTSESLRDLDSLPDRIRQHRQADPRPVVIVEGPSDRRLLRRITGDAWSIFVATTRNQVTGTLEQTNKMKIDRIAGLIDRDFDNHFDECVKAGLPVFTFKEADLEATLIRGSWFDLLVDEYASEDKVKRKGLEELRELCIAIAGVIGILRKANSQHSWGIDFSKLDFGRKLDSRTLRLATSRLAAAVSPSLPDRKARTIFQSMLSDLETMVDRGAGSFRGRDALEVLRIALQRAYGSIRIDDVEILAAAIRLAADSSFLSIDPFPELQTRLH